MKILHRYVLKQLLRNLGLSLGVFCMLFLIVDFFERIDNIIVEGASIWTVLLYFALKVPVTIGTTLPIAMLVAVLFTIGILSKNSEITAMRAAGTPVLWIIKPIVIAGLALSVFALVFNETIVPICARRVTEIYNFDIKHKTEDGSWDQADFWWRSKDAFYSAASFDSRSNRLLGLTKIEVNEDGHVSRRTEAKEARWIDPLIGWNMAGAVEYNFSANQDPHTVTHRSLPLLIREEPKDFYEADTDPQTMSFFALRKFIKHQRETGIAVSDYIADYYSKFSFPFVIFLIPFLVTPFALKPGRNTSMAIGFLGGLIVGLSYYAVHSLSLAMGRAEIWPPLLAAWAANILMALVGFVLQMGTESPS